VNEVAAEVGLNASGCQYFLLARGEGSQFDQNFNPELKSQSQYFGAMQKMMACAEKNADVSVEKRNTVCAKEFKQLRLAAFNEQLLYQNMNERFFMSENAMKNHESAM
jgi:hypothetical protein